MTVLLALRPGGPPGRSCRIPALPDGPPAGARAVPRDSPHPERGLPSASRACDRPRMSKRHLSTRARGAFRTGDAAIASRPDRAPSIRGGLPAAPEQHPDLPLGRRIDDLDAGLLAPVRGTPRERARLAGAAAVAGRTAGGAVA